MQAGDGGRDDALGAEAEGGVEAVLLEPGLVEGDFLGGVGVGCVGEVFMCARRS